MYVVYVRSECLHSILIRELNLIFLAMLHHLLYTWCSGLALMGSLARSRLQSPDEAFQDDHVEWDNLE